MKLVSKGAVLFLATSMLLLVGCSHRDDSGTTSAAAREAPLVPPADPNDAAAWRAFLGQAILAETHDPKLHPYAFIVPAGDAADPVDRRKGEAAAIHSMLGHTAVPGNMLALTGPDSTKVAEVIDEAFKDVPARGTEGLTILYVGAPAAVANAQYAVKAAGAELRVRATQAP